MDGEGGGSCGCVDGCMRGLGCVVGRMNAGRLKDMQTERDKHVERLMDIHTYIYTQIAASICDSLRTTEFLI